MIQLGQTIKDRISGLEGIVIVRTTWLHGCTRITFQPTGSKDGKPFDSCSVDEAQVHVVNAVSAFADVQGKNPPAGPTPEPSRNSDPSR